MKMIQSKKLIIIFIALSLFIIHPASAVFQGTGDKITFTDIPDKVKIRAGQNAEFDTVLTNTGTQYGDIALEFRNLPEGITVIEGNKYKLIDVKKSITYHVVLAADENVKEGIYSFDIADNSDIDVRTWETITLIVGDATDAELAGSRVSDDPQTGDENRKLTPAFTFTQLLAVLLTTCIAIRMRKHEPK